MEPDDYYKLSVLESTQVASVLDDCLDQLNILGSIMPKSYENRQNVQDVSCFFFVSFHHLNFFY